MWGYDAMMHYQPISKNLERVMKGVYRLLMFVIWPHTKLSSSILFGWNWFGVWFVVIACESIVIAGIFQFIRQKADIGVTQR